MHDSASRLYEAAKESRGLTVKSDVARAMNESPQTLANWESRGVSAAGAISAEKAFGCRASWLLEGVEPKTWMLPTLNGGAPMRQVPAIETVVDLARAVRVTVAAVAELSASQWEMALGALRSVIGRPERIDDAADNLTSLLRNPTGKGSALGHNMPKFVDSQ